jgi:hypothetical protein
VSLLVVNATTIAGKAGDVKADLDEEDFQRVTAANAKGDYPAGANYVLMEEENAALISLIEELTGLEFEYSDQDNAEDPQGSYTAVVVFADEGNSQNTSETSATDEEETEVVAEE